MNMFAEKIGEVIDIEFVTNNCGNVSNISADLPVSSRGKKFIAWFDGAQKDQ